MALQILNFELLGEDRFTVGQGDDPNDDASVILSRKGIVMPSIIISSENGMWIAFDTDGSDPSSVFKVDVQEMNYTGTVNQLIYISKSLVSF